MSGDVETGGLVTRRATARMLDCSYGRVRAFERDGLLVPVETRGRRGAIQFAATDVERLAAERREERAARRTHREARLTGRLPSPVVVRRRPLRAVADEETAADVLPSRDYDDDDDGEAEAVDPAEVADDASEGAAQVQAPVCAASLLPLHIAGVRMRLDRQARELHALRAEIVALRAELRDAVEAVVVLAGPPHRRAS